MTVTFDKILGTLRESDAVTSIDFGFPVPTYADLPTASLYPGKIFLVEQGTGVWLVNRKPAGFYRSNSSTWDYLGRIKDTFYDGNFKIVNVSDNTKVFNFNAIEITSGQTREIKIADYDYDLNKPLINYIDGITGLSNPSHVEGRLFYDDVEKTWVIYNDRVSVSLQLGRELWLRACNNTGSSIINGTVVYVSGVDAGCPEISLAQPDQFDMSRIIGVATEDILNTEQGEVTSFGLVRNIDTSGLGLGVVYLGSNGTLTNTIPSGNQFTVIIGRVLISDISNGLLLINPDISDITVEVTDTNGFPNRSDTTLSFSNSIPDRTFTISPVGNEFYYYIAGKLYLKESSESVQISNDEGLHVIYYDADILSTLYNPSSADIDNIIRIKALISYIYWDVDNQIYSYFAEERHGISMSPVTHVYLHFTRGAQYLQGLGIGDIISSGDGSIDSHAQFSIESGFISDEDLINAYSTITVTTGLPIYYLVGPTGNMRRILNIGFSVLDDITAGTDITGRLVWNEFTGTTWQLTTVTNNYYILCHVFAINGYSGEDKQIAVVGQGEYNLLTNAQGAASTEIGGILTQFPFQEIVPIATIIFQTGNTYGNSVKARIRPALTGDYVDWRVTELAQGSNPSNHGNLTGLIDDTHPQYLHLPGRSGGQYLYGSNLSSEGLNIESTSDSIKGSVNIQPNGGETNIGAILNVPNIFINQTDIVNNPNALEIVNLGSGNSLNINDLFRIDKDSNIRLEFSKRIIFGLTTIDPYLWYNFNELSGSLLSDISGNARNGTTINSPLWVPGKLNNCLSFNGTNEYVNCGNIAGFEVTDKFSVDMWVNENGAGGFLLTKRAVGPGIGWSVSLSGTHKFQLVLSDGANFLASRTVNSFSVGVWNHVVITYDGTNTYAGIKIYVNNVLQSTTNLSSGTPSTMLNAVNLNIGAYANGVTPFNGQIDDTLILSEVVDSVYVGNRWNGGAGTEQFPGTSSTCYLTNVGGKIYLNFGGGVSQFVFTGSGLFGIGTDTPDGLLDVTPDTITTNSFSYPFPRVTTTQRNSMLGMLAGAHVYDTDLNSVYYYNGSAWTLAY